MCPLSRLDIADIPEYIIPEIISADGRKVGQVSGGLGKGRRLLLGDILTAVITTAYLTQRLHSRETFSLSYTLLCLSSIGDKG